MWIAVKSTTESGSHTFLVQSESLARRRGRPFDDLVGHRCCDLKQIGQGVKNAAYVLGSRSCEGQCDVYVARLFQRPAMGTRPDARLLDERIAADVFFVLVTKCCKSFMNAESTSGSSKCDHPRLTLSSWMLDSARMALIGIGANNGTFGETDFFPKKASSPSSSINWRPGYLTTGSNRKHSGDELDKTVSGELASL